MSNNSPLKHRFFTPELKEQLDEIVKYSNNTEIISREAANVLTRIKTLSGDIKTFTMSTSANPNDLLVYTATTTNVRISSN